MDSFVPQQDTPQKFGGSIWGSSIETINVVGNSVEAVIKELQSAPVSQKGGSILEND
jgi:hypothetical protein